MDVKNIFKLIVAHTREVVPELEGHDFKRSDSLKELGADSVDRSEILIKTMESLSLNIPAVALYGPKNLGELAEVIYEKQPA